MMPSFLPIRSSSSPRGILPLAGLCAMFLLGATAAQAGPGDAGPANATPHPSIDRAGTIPTNEGLTLRISADLGSVTIQKQSLGGPRAVRYSLHVETDAPQPLAQSLLESYQLRASSSPTGVVLTGNLPAQLGRQSRRAQFWVQFVVTVPSTYNVEVSTGGGEIRTSDIGGFAVLETQGGNISAGKIGYRSMAHVPPGHPVAKLETMGGHITVEDVSGDLDAYTAGGHILAGNVAGNARLRSGGGHVRAGEIRGAAQLETEGGNVTVGQAGALVSVRTGGGQIDFGEVHGPVRAQTAGGGIRMMYAAGPLEIASVGGGICLTNVTNTIRAETIEGNITAWIAPSSPDVRVPVRLAGPSQLASSSGDIIVFIPRNIAATIDASVETGGTHRIEADPALLLNTSARPDGAARAVGSLNGGGSVLKLRTASGKIRVQYVDSDAELREALEREQRARIAARLTESGIIQASATTIGPDRAPTVAVPPTEGPWLDYWMDRLEVTFLGGLREDEHEFLKRFNDQPAPVYPNVARRAGVQGRVRLQVRLRTDGSVAVEKVLAGEPSLVDAATEAVRRWHGTPQMIAGKKVDVISTLTFNFDLR